jgi:hypothetical protein
LLLNLEKKRKKVRRRPLQRWPRFPVAMPIDFFSGRFVDFIIGA